MDESEPGATGYDWDEIQRVFLEVRLLPPADRSGRLDSACAGDEAKRAIIEDLLHHGETPDPEWMCPPGDTSPPPIDPVPPPRNGPEPIPGFEIRSLIGSGAMGDVYEAIQDGLHRTVALKIMKPGFDIRRFEQEREILGRLRHPGIAKVYTAGSHEGSSGPIPYFAMEYIPRARTLTQYADDWNLSVRERLELFAEICDAVQDAHQSAIVHRDLKPGNILVDGEGHPKIIDFGVARAANNITVDRRRQVCGTWAYMSPEQLDGDPHGIDQRSDVYTLGVVLYELLCGRLPYSDTSDKAIRTQQPVPPSALNADLASDIDQVILKALGKRPGGRYRNAGELGDAVKRCAERESPGPKPVPDPVPIPPPPPDPDSPGSRWKATLMALCVVALVAGLLSPLAPQFPERTESALPAEVTVTVMADGQPLDRGSVAERANVKPMLQANKAGFLYAFQLGPQDIQPVQCAGGCQSVKYTPNAVFDTGCIYPGEGEGRGLYVVFAVLLSKRNDDLCDLVVSEFRFDAVDPRAEGQVRTEIMRILGGRRGLLGYGASTYARP